MVKQEDEREDGAADQDRPLSGAFAFRGLDLVLPVDGAREGADVRFKLCAALRTGRRAVGDHRIAFWTNHGKTSLFNRLFPKRSY